MGKPHRRMQFVSDRLVEQVIAGRKTASVARLGEVDRGDGDFDDPLVVGEVYDVYDSTLTPRATIRVIAMGLWRGETNTSADEFREDHLGYFDHPGMDFEFVAYYFQLVEGSSVG